MTFDQPQSKSVIRGVLGMSASRLVASLLGLLATTLIARSLPPGDLGLFAIVVGCYSYLVIAGEGGLRSVAMSEGAYRGGVGAVLGTYLMARTVLSAGLTLIAIAVILIWFDVHSTVAVPVVLSCLVVPFQGDWILLMAGRYQAAGWAVASRWVFYCGFVAAVAYFDFLTLSTLAVLFTASWVLSVLFSWCLVIRSGIALRLGERGEKVTKFHLISLGWPVLTFGFLSQLMMNGDLLLIGTFSGTTNAATYYIASAVITAGCLLANSIYQIALPRYGRLRDDHAAFSRQLKSDLLLVTCISPTLALGTIFILPKALPWVFGEAYIVSGQLVAFFAPYLVIYHLHALTSACCVSLGLQKKTVIGLAIMALVVPVSYMLAVSTGNMALVAYSKGFVFLGAAVVMILPMPSSHRADFLRYSSPLLGLAVLMAWALSLGAAYDVVGLAELTSP